MGVKETAQHGTAKRTTQELGPPSAGDQGDSSSCCRAGGGTPAKPANRAHVLNEVEALVVIGRPRGRRFWIWRGRDRPAVAAVASQ